MNCVLSETIEILGPITDGRIDSLSVEFCLPVGKISSEEIKEQAAKALKLQNQIIQGFIKKNGSSNSNGHPTSNRANGNGHGAVAAQLLNIDAMDTKRGRSLFILKTAVEPKETKEDKKSESFTQTRTLTCRVNGGCLRTSFFSAFFVLFGHPTAGFRFISVFVDNQIAKLATYAARTGHGGARWRSALFPGYFGVAAGAFPVRWSAISFNLARNSGARSIK